MIQKHIPNLITLLNLLCGVLAIKYGFEGNFEIVLALVLLAAVFDFLDGFMARLLNAYSPMGKELDSLADLVSFGIAPSAILFYYLTSTIDSILPTSLHCQPLLPYIAFIIPLASALRLAKFNVDTNQTYNFVGLPTPANGILWVSLMYSISLQQTPISELSFYILMIGVALFSYLLLSPLPLLSLKIQKKKWNLENISKLIVVISTLICIAVFQHWGITISIILYLIISICYLIINRVTIR